jgi:aerobic carbon-monoxide dehydrogenase large subunit
MCTVIGPYKIANIHSEFYTAYTNLPPSGAVRGAGRPQAVLVMERMMDRAAEALQMDPAELRRRNLIPPEEFPYPVGMIFRDSAPLTYDSGDYPELLRRALELAEYDRARQEQAELREQGRYRGIGIALGTVIIDACKPFRWRDVWDKMFKLSGIDEDRRRETAEKWQDVLGSLITAPKPD